MDFDLRLPVGGMFVLFGLTIGGYGAFVPVDTQGLNVDLVWGGVMLVFGTILLALARFGKPAAADSTPVDGDQEAASPELANSGSSR